MAVVSHIQYVASNTSDLVVSWAASHGAVAFRTTALQPHVVADEPLYSLAIRVLLHACSVQNDFQDAGTIAKLVGIVSNTQRSTSARTDALCIIALLCADSPMNQRHFRKARGIPLCLELLDVCDEVRVYGDRVTDGMRAELQHAEARGIVVSFASTGGAS